MRRTGRSIVKKNCLVSVCRATEALTDAGHRLVFLDHREDAVGPRDEGLALRVRHAAGPEKLLGGEPLRDRSKAYNRRAIVRLPGRGAPFWDL